MPSAVLISHLVHLLHSCDSLYDSLVTAYLLHSPVLAMWSRTFLVASVNLPLTVVRWMSNSSSEYCGDVELRTKQFSIQHLLKHRHLIRQRLLPSRQQTPAELS